MYRKFDYLTLEREYVTGDMSVRELCRRHGIGNHSVVHAQAKRRDWYAKRAAYRGRAEHRTLERMADVEARRAEREFEVRDDALEAMDDAINRMRDDLRATKRVKVDGEWVEEPVMRIGPKEFVALMDRLQTMFLNRPSRITEERTLGVTVEAPDQPSIELLKRFVRLDRERSWGLEPGSVWPIDPPDPSEDF